MPAGGNRPIGPAATSNDLAVRRRVHAGIQPHGAFHRHSATRQAWAFAAAACASLVTPAFALDLNSFRAQHGRLARSGGHRANMLRRDVSNYGLASADGANGKSYWVLELGN